MAWTHCVAAPRNLRGRCRPRGAVPLSLSKERADAASRASTLRGGCSVGGPIWPANIFMLMAFC
eukprot:11205236-Lingulodinium_polyedra.AAC.1